MKCDLGTSPITACFYFPPVVVVGGEGWSTKTVARVDVGDRRFQRRAGGGTICDPFAEGGAATDSMKDAAAESIDWRGDENDDGAMINWCFLTGDYKAGDRGDLASASRLPAAAMPSI